MGIIMAFAQARVAEMKTIKDVGIGTYIKAEQPLRKMLLLEYLDWLRPRKRVRAQTSQPLGARNRWFGKWDKEAKEED